MTHNEKQLDRFDQLRQQAEHLLRDRPDTVSEPPADILELIHELRVHQAELEIQNEELQRAQHDLSILHKEYQDLYEFAPCGYLTLNAKGIITHANLTAVQLLGADRGHLLRSALTSYVAGESELPFIKARKTAGATGGKQSVEVALKGEAAAATRWVQADIEADRDENEAVIRWRIVLVDITKRKQAEVAYAEAEVDLRQAQKLQAIGDLAGGTAHEINNPINGIMNYAQLLKDALEGRDDRLAEFASEILHETERVATIVKNLLSFARHDDKELSPARVTDIVKTVLSLISYELRRDQIEFDLNVPEDLPEIACSSPQMQQVLMNLLTNARDALNERYPGSDEDKKIIITAKKLSPVIGHPSLGAGAPSAVISQESLDTNVQCPMTNDAAQPPMTNVAIRITVEDHGAGIREEACVRIFDPFYTTRDRSRTADGRFGRGLGLAISHGIVRAHGGELSVESEAGAWTRFHVDLPLVADVEKLEMNL